VLADGDVSNRDDCNSNSGSGGEQSYSNGDCGLDTEQRRGRRHIEPGGELDQSNVGELLLHRCAEPERQPGSWQLDYGVLTGCSLGWCDHVYRDRNFDDRRYSYGFDYPDSDRSGAYGDCNSIAEPGTRWRHSDTVGQLDECDVDDVFVHWKRDDERVHHHTEWKCSTGDGVSKRRYGLVHYQCSWAWRDGDGNGGLHGSPEAANGDRCVHPDELERRCELQPDNEHYGR
jgi:hypothetical protein